MPSTRNVYIPRWTAWFGAVVVGLIWLWTSYRVWFTERGRSDLGIDGWIVMSLVFLVVLTILFLMGYRKLPAYQIEDTDRGSD